MTRFVYSGTGIALTKSFESCRLVAYLDSGGVPTIGWGHTKDVYIGMTCTQEQADTWLADDYHWAENIVNAVVTYPINQNEFDALVDFEFNTGALPKSTLLLDLNEGKVAEAAKQFEVWDHAKGKVIAGLLRRRLAEESLFLEAMDNEQTGTE